MSQNISLRFGWSKLALTTALAAIFIVLTFLTDPIRFVSESFWREITANRTYAFITEIVIRLFVVVLAGLLLWNVKRKLWTSWRNQDVDLSPGPPHPDIPADDHKGQQLDIIEAIDVVQERYSNAAIALFCRMLSSTQYQIRVTERAELLGASLRMRVSTDYVMSAHERARLSSKDETHQKGGQNFGDSEPHQECLPVPVLKVSKGTLLDNLDVTDSNNVSLPVLSQQEARGLVAIAVLILFRLTFGPVTPGSSQDTALWALRRLVSRMGRVSSHIVESKGDENQSLQKVFRAAVEGLSPSSVGLLDELETFCCFFAKNYVVIADIPTPPSVRFLLKYTKTIPLYGQTLGHGRKRTELGLVPYRFRVPLNLAFTAESYHFRMDIGEGQFASGHYIAEVATDRHLAQPEIRKRTNKGYIRTRYRSGLPYAHLYTRGLNRSTPQEWTTVVEFAEVPPGALGATTIVATISASLVLLLSFVPPSGGPSADTSAFLLAVPLFAATLVGHSIERVQRSSFTTYVGLVITGLTSFLGAVVFGLLPDDPLVVRDVGVVGLVQLPSLNIAGVIIAFISIANVAFLRWRLKYQMNQYLSMLDRWKTLDKPS